MASVLRALLAAIAYFASARLGYAFAIQDSVVTLWPPAGVMLGLLLRSGNRSWPAIAIGGFVGSAASDLWSNYTFGLALAAAFANVAESVAAAWLVTRRVGRPVELRTLRAVLWFTLLAPFLANSVTACLGAAVLNLGFHTPPTQAWFVWWVGDGLGMLIVAPAVIAWAAAGARRRRPRAARLAEGAVLVGALIAVVQIADGRPDRLVQLEPYAAFPFLFWAAIRLGPTGAATTALVVAVATTAIAASGAGPFVSAHATALSTALDLYTYLAVVSLSSLIVAAVLDERRAAERRMSDSEERYRAVVESATDAIVTIDTDSRILLVNQAAQRIFGHAAAELIGRPLTTLMPAALRERHVAGMTRYLTTGERRIEWRGTLLPGLHRDGREIPLEISFGELQAGGRPVFMGVIRDISDKLAAERALRTAEERMRFALEASRVGTWDLDVATNAMPWSGVLEALHGLAPGSFGGTFDAFLACVDPEDREQVRREFERAIKERTDANVVYRTTWPDGGVHWLTGVGRTFYDEAGRPVRAAGIAMDVTERRALEEQYRQAQKMEAVGRLAGGVAHDFNNLLTIIIGHADMLKHSAAVDQAGEADLAVIDRAAQRASELTRQLLAFSRKQVLDPSVVNLNVVVANVDKMLRRLIGEDVDMAIRLAPDLGSVSADAGQVEQLLMNLAVNARDAMPEGGRLTIETGNVYLDADYARTHPEVEPGPHVMIAVSDTGVGMEPAVKARIFEPFFTTKEKGRGTGLGLSTVYGTVKQSGGHIWVYSERGAGTAFRVYFPRVEGPPSPAKAPDAPAGALRGSETVLVAEDEAELRRFMISVLTGHGYRVIEAANGTEAVARCADDPGPIHLVVTDVIMPEMGGKQLADAVARSHPKARVLFISGYTEDAVVHHGRLNAGVDLLSKPFNGTTLLKRVRTILDRPG
jgi:two-component system, cell cycle sensor histidine kinase and response regulator CckA